MSDKQEGALTLNIPSDLQSTEQQLKSVQKCLFDLQKGFNTSTTSPSVIAHLPTFIDSTTRYMSATTPEKIPGWSWTINSRGGLVCISALFSVSAVDGSPSSSANFEMYIDNVKTLAKGIGVTVSNSNCNIPVIFDYKQILGKGKHKIDFYWSVLTVVTRIYINLSGITSEASIIEFPTNIQNLNVASN